MKKKYQNIIWLILGLAIILALILLTTFPSRAAEMVVYKSPSCGCCQKWVEHMRRNGFQVEVHNQNNMSLIKQEYGVPAKLRSCHTAIIDGYVIEGHVPASEVKRLLTEKPAGKGLAVPGMPMGSPGMEGWRQDPYAVLLWQTDGQQIYTRY